MHHVAVTVAEHLHLDVARPLDQFLDENKGIAERALRLALRRRQQLGQLCCAIDAAHAAPTATGDRLDHHGEADFFGFGGQRGRILFVALIARHHGHAGFDGDLLCRRLAAERAHGIGRGSDEDETGVGHRLREVRIFREEPIARMDRIRARAQSSRNDRVAPQITVGGGRRADVHGLVGLADMQRLGVGVRIDGDGRHAQTARGADDPTGDFASIGDQDFFEHGVLMADGCRGAAGFRKAARAGPAVVAGVVRHPANAPRDDECGRHRTFNTR